MKNREVFQRDPAVTKLLNDGVAAVSEAVTEQEMQTLRYELEHFVCEGQYEDGTIRILESYIGNINSTTQPAAWVSGFYGSGKSHLLKMFRHLWVNTPFPDGATARGLARLPQEVQDLLRELDTLGRRYGGLHAAAGTLPSVGVGKASGLLSSASLCSPGGCRNHCHKHNSVCGCSAMGSTTKCERLWRPLAGISAQSCMTSM
jgi:hypothetical protein